MSLGLIYDNRMYSMRYTKYLSMLSYFKQFFDFNVREVKRLQLIVNQVNAHEGAMQKLTDDQLREKTDSFKKRVQQDGTPLSDILPEAYALVREASRRVLGQRHFDTQVLAGIALHEGKIAEQKTGEGKTLTATLALYLNALTGKGAHLVTVNDYLARRDAGWMGRLFSALGLSTSAIIADTSYLFDPTHEEQGVADPRLIHLRKVDRRQAYEADITYGINSEFGFDYLRDNMADDPARMVQRGFHFAIVDEADSVLIDEARTPHIISAPVTRDISKYYEYARLVTILQAGSDYVIDEKLRTANLTDEGISKIEQALGVGNIYERDFDTLFHIEAALKAQTLFRKDKDYIVADGEVVIVDEFTGRLLQGRRFSEGLHQAIEAKENVGIKQESKTLATVSLQNYFRMYQKLSGMTGTAATEAEEFAKIYKAEVVVVPTHRPMLRQDLPDMIYKTEKGKYHAVADEIAKHHKAGRPVLVGTTSIEKNEYLSNLLRKRGVPHELLNAKNHEKEASIIAKAGERGAVTVATNMAGRGVDIILGGADGEEKDAVIALGGLLVLGTERHESRRIDNQLRGRSGRQGDPGTSQFFVSLEDDLMRIFGGDQIGKLMTFFNFPEDQPLSHNMVSKAIESAQQKVEGHNFDIRKHLVEYDDVLNKQREIVYGFRRKLLESISSQDEPIEDVIDEKIRTMISDYAVNTFGIGESDEREHLVEQLSKEISTVFRLPEEKVRTVIQTSPENEEKLAHELYALVSEGVQVKREKVGVDVWRRVLRYIGLSAVDNIWTEHLTAIEDLRQGINLRGYGQMDPLIEYKNEAFKLFESLMRTLDTEIVRGMMYVEFKDDAKQTQTLSQKDQPMVLQAAGGVDPYTKAVADQAKTTQSKGPSGLRTPAQVAQQATPRIGRNDPCWCGSGKKWKRCHFPETG